MSEWSEKYHTAIDHVLLSELGVSPLRSIINRKLGVNSLLSIEIRPKDIYIPKGSLHSPIRVLNMHRDNFRDLKYRIVFWVPGNNAREICSTLANLADYSTCFDADR